MLILHRFVLRQFMQEQNHIINWGLSVFAKEWSKQDGNTVHL